MWGDALVGRVGLPEALFPLLCSGTLYEAGTAMRPKEWEHHLLSTHEETIQLIVHINFYRASSAAVITPIKQLWRMMQGDKPTTSTTTTISNKKKAVLIFHYTFLLLFLSLYVPLNLPPPLPYDMMVNLLPGNLLCDVVHTSVEPKREEKKILDKI